MGFSLNVEILILIGVIYLILVINTVSSCCNVTGIMEGYESGGVIGGTDEIVKDTAKQVKRGVGRVGRFLNFR